MRDDRQQIRGPRKSFRPASEACRHADARGVSPGSTWVAERRQPGAIRGWRTNQLAEGSASSRLISSVAENSLQSTATPSYRPQNHFAQSGDWGSWVGIPSRPMVRNTSRERTKLSIASDTSRRNHCNAMLSAAPRFPSNGSCLFGCAVMTSSRHPDGRAP
jgi:hypothetical protein